MNEHELLDYESDTERDKDAMDFCDEDEDKVLKKFGILDEKPKIVRSKSAPETGIVKVPINELVVVERAIVGSKRESVEPIALGANSHCSGVEEHGTCSCILVQDIFPNLPTQDPLRRIQLSSLGELIPVVLAKEKGILLGHIRNWANSNDEPTSLFKHIPNFAPNSQDFVSPILIWVDHCAIAFQSLKKSGMKNTKFHVAKTNGLYRFGELINEAMEEVKAKNILGFQQLEKSHFLFYGDSSARELAQKLNTTFIASKSAAELSIDFQTTYFSSKVGEILIQIGNDELNDQFSKVKYKQAIQKIINHSLKFSTKTLIIPPPFNLKKNLAHGELLQILSESVPNAANISLAMTKGFRSLPEVTRFGNLENRRMVDEYGKLKAPGPQYIAHFLKDVFEMQTPFKVEQAAKSPAQSPTIQAPSNLFSFNIPPPPIINYGYQSRTMRSNRTRGNAISRQNRGNFRNPGDQQQSYYPYPPKRARY